MRHCIAAPLTAACLLAGCASPDHVLFVTKTSLGIDFDSKPVTASIAYDRIEGYVAPRYDNGEIPPVVASVRSDGAIFNPKMRQIYATGDAALIVTGSSKPVRERRMDGGRQLMFFGTTTTVGLKIGFTTALPDSVVFGFKRKEYSYIPLGTVLIGGKSYDVYPSVLASIDTIANAASPETSSLSNSQFFATGAAARLLAADPGVRSGFVDAAQKAVQATQLQKVQTEEREADRVHALLVSITGSFKDKETSVEEKEEIVAFAKSAGMDSDNSMTSANFVQKLARFSSTGTDVPAQLLKLQDKIKAVLAQ